MVSRVRLCVRSRSVEERSAMVERIVVKEPEVQSRCVIRESRLCVCEWNYFDEVF